jgi:hypothetical protein
LQIYYGAIRFPLFPTWAKASSNPLLEKIRDSKFFVVEKAVPSLRVLHPVK